MKSSRMRAKTDNAKTATKLLVALTEIKPEPPVTPVGMGKSTRGVELASVDDLDQRQAASWMKQAAAMPFIGGEGPGSDGRRH